jgi:hypothetical protein
MPAVLRVEIAVVESAEVPVLEGAESTMHQKAASVGMLRLINMNGRFTEKSMS